MNNNSNIFLSFFAVYQELTGTPLVTHGNNVYKCILSTNGDATVYTELFDKDNKSPIKIDDLSGIKTLNETAKEGRYFNLAEILLKDPEFTTKLAKNAFQNPNLALKKASDTQNLPEIYIGKNNFKIFSVNYEGAIYNEAVEIENLLQKIYKASKVKATIRDAEKIYTIASKNAEYAKKSKDVDAMARLVSNKKELATKLKSITTAKKYKKPEAKKFTKKHKIIIILIGIFITFLFGLTNFFNKKGAFAPGESISYYTNIDSFITIYETNNKIKFTDYRKGLIKKNSKDSFQSVEIIRLIDFYYNDLKNEK